MIRIGVFNHKIALDKPVKICGSNITINADIDTTNPLDVNIINTNAIQVSQEPYTENTYSHFSYEGTSDTNVPAGAIYGFIKHDWNIGTQDYIEIFEGATSIIKLRLGEEYRIINHNDDHLQSSFRSPALTVVSNGNQYRIDCKYP